MTERKIQRRIVKAIRERWPRLVVHHSTPPQSSREARIVAKNDGMLPGFPDLIIVGLRQEGVLFLEVKSATGRVSETQHTVHARLGSLGWPVRTVSTVENALDAVETHFDG